MQVRKAVRRTMSALYRAHLTVNSRATAIACVVCRMILSSGPLSSLHALKPPS